MSEETKPYAAGWCVHYKSPMRFKRCGAGFSLNKFDDHPSNRWPCFSTSFDPAPCAKRRLPTKAEIETYKKASDAMMTGLSAAIKLVEPLRGQWKATKKGQIAVHDCPKCKRKRGLTVAVEASRGHSRGQCTSKGCISWIE